MSCHSSSNRNRNCVSKLLISLCRRNWNLEPIRKTLKSRTFSFRKFPYTPFVYSPVTPRNIFEKDNTSDQLSFPKYRRASLLQYPNLSLGKRNPYEVL